MALEVRGMNLIKENKNFRLVFFGALVSSIGDVLFNFAIGLYILDITHSAFMLSLYGVVGGITWILLAPFGGVWVDRLSRVKIIYWTDLIRGCTFLLCGMMMVFIKDRTLLMIGLCVTSIISAMNGALFGPASQAIIPLTVESDKLMKANSLMSLMYGIKDVIGMLVAGVLYAWIGPIIIVFINGISFIISGITERFISIEETVSESKSQVLKEFKEGFGYIISQNKAIVFLLVIINLKNLALGPIQSVLVPYLMSEQLQANEMHLSYLYVAMALGGVVGSLLLSQNYFKDKTFQIMKISLFILMITLVFQWGIFHLLLIDVVSYLGFLIVLFLVFVISGSINVLFYVPIMVSLQQLVHADFYGRVMSLFTMISSITTPISLMVGGVIIDYLGIDAMYIFSMIFLVISLVFIKNLKKVATATF